jgi:ferritin-like metal-binding protein YciE
VLTKAITMTANDKTVTNLHDLLVNDARRFTSAEVELKNMLPEWINKAGSIKLKAVLQKYADFVQAHIQKLEAFFEVEKIGSLHLTNRIMLSFIDDANEKIADCTDAEIRDVCLLACIQGINHFKISMYGTAAAFANTLGLEKPAAIFHEAEINEKQIDDRLSQLAEHEVNRKAIAPIVLP